MSNLKPFGVLSTIDIVASVRRLFIETTMSIDKKTPNNLRLNISTNDCNLDHSAVF